MTANLLAMGAIVMWASLATLGVKIGSVASASGPLSFLGCRQICSFYCSIVIWVFVPDSLRRGNPAQVDWANLRIGMIQWADRMTIFPKIGYLKKLRTDPQLR